MRHPTQKPVESLTPLIEAYCPPGGIVLDPFAGSGTTALAARDAGRRFILIEKDGDHAATARKRVAAPPQRLQGAKMPTVKHESVDRRRPRAQSAAPKPPAGKSPQLA
ncbi:MAG: site-specific DNA-methyltransferase [Phycisphaerales bacterium]|nr:hypothetical protein [Planctomycetota bacterium]